LLGGTLLLLHPSNKASNRFPSSSELANDSIMISSMQHSKAIRGDALCFYFKQ